MPTTREVELKSTSISRIAISLITVFAAFFTQATYALDSAKLLQAVQAEENVLQARIGMAVIDTNTGSTWDYRGDERFPLNSTHKTFTCAALLAKSDKQPHLLSQEESIRKEMLVSYSPITEKLLSPDTITFDRLCQAAVSYSDNTAANVAFDAIGGSAGFNAFMRSLGDAQTRLDRKEPELNEATPGDLRDTTKPIAIVQSLKKVLLDDGLPASAQATLKQWMLDDQVANALLRAALPADWKIADKTGAGGHGSRSIIAVIWPPARQPLVVSIYITQTQAPMAESNQAIARIGSALKESINPAYPSPPIH